MHNHHQSESSGSSCKLGVGIAAMAAVGALAYFLYGTKAGSDKREKIASWARETKDKAVSTGADLGDIGAKMYAEMKTLLRDKYEDVKKLNKKELAKLADQVRENWEKTKKDIGKALEEAGIDKDEDEDDEG